MAGILAVRPVVPRILAGSILCLLWMTKACSANCYLPNGTDANAAAGQANLEDYAPCNAGAAFSMCCAIGPERVAQGSADTCVANNSLCLSNNGKTYWRESCTDPTWTDSACIHLYTSGNNDVTLTNCSDGSWCTGGGYSANGNQTCCDVHDGYFIYPDGSLSKTNPNSTTTSTASSSASTTPSTGANTQMSPTSSGPSLSSPTVLAGTATPRATMSAAPSSGLSAGAWAGVGIGIGVVFVAMLSLLAAYFLRRRRRIRSAPPHQERKEMHQPEPPGEMQGTPVYPEMDHSPTYNPRTKQSYIREPAAGLVQLE